MTWNFEITTNYKTEFEMYFKFFKQNCKDKDYEFGEKVWNELCKFSYIECSEEECLMYYYAIVAPDVNFKGDCLKWFIKAHVSFRKWKEEEAELKKYKGPISH